MTSTSSLAQASVLSGEAIVASYDGPARRWQTRTSERRAVDDVSIDIRAGEIVGVVGRSGSGKTSLARCLAGLLPLHSGKIGVDGVPVPTRRNVAVVPRVRGVQMAFQDPASTLNPRRQIGSILTEILRVHRLCPRNEVQDRARALLSMVGLNPTVMTKRPTALSGGMCQRVAIARALAFQPRVLIADEIVSALDASVQAQVMNMIAEIRETQAISVMFVTHDLAVVSQLCDRVVVMHSGRIVEQGATRTVLDQPTTEPTRQLLDSVLELAPRTGP
ncbi:ABC transporter ATP-binding protein [Mycobacterium antarcticum]|uniref:ABC transporter ATP-binding protein n=1 Tax=Mycolicibacterium sp. TUM20984 TaxID=3023368 RepID=UPI0023859E0D|nr:ATP-binding cassette domain-containing protein [Mycolicibacterium sp. TUM20984]GLP83020.1 ABC transporter ATP-binding protein [Mycolicibacterium sp. TUM20984]